MIKIYKIVNDINDKIYIGQTKQTLENGYNAIKIGKGHITWNKGKKKTIKK